MSKHMPCAELKQCREAYYSQQLELVETHKELDELRQNSYTESQIIKAIGRDGLWKIKAYFSKE